MSLHFNYFFSIKCLIWWKGTRNHPFVQTLQVFEQTTMFWHFHELFSKKLQKVPHFVKKHEKSSIWPKLCNFLNKLPCLLISINFWGKGWKRGSFREKARKIIDLSKTCNFSKKLPCFCISMNFSGKSCKKCLISWKSTKNHRFGQNFATFRTNYHVFAFRWTFKEKFGKSASFREKARKNIDLAKTCNFSNKLPCFCISMNNLAKSCKKLLMPWKSTKNHRFGQNLQLYRANYHVFAFRWTFQEEVAKSASFREKGRKLVELAKTCNFSKKLPCFGILMIIAGKSCKKWFVSWKSTKNHRFGQNFATFRTIYHVFAFRWSFQQEVGKSGSFREKARKIIDLANNMQLFEQTTMFFIWMNFSGRSCKKCLISWKRTKTRRFSQNLQLFEETTMFWHLDDYCRKKLQKVVRFVKKHEKSSIWSKLCNFSNNLPCFCISMKFSARSCKEWLISWKSTKNHRFGQQYATFRTNYHVFYLDELFRKKLQKVPHFVKKDENSSI